MKSIPFSHDYVKMDWPIFTTLRRVPYWAEGEDVVCKFPSKTINCTVFNVKTLKLADVRGTLVCLDTWIKGKPMPSYVEALRLLAELAKSSQVLSSTYSIITLINLDYAKVGYIDWRSALLMKDNDSTVAVPDWQKTDPHLDTALTETVKNDAQRRLKEIQTIIETVDERRLAINPVPWRKEEIAEKEVGRIYVLAKGEEAK